MAEIMIVNLLKKIFHFGQRKIDSTYFSICEKANYQIAENSIIINSKIILENDSQLIIGKNVVIDNYSIRIVKGVFTIGDNTQLIGVKNTNSNSVFIDSGSLSISNNCIIQSEFCIRYGGICKIDCYTGIMYGTEIRCDEQLSIGKYNMISYECMIYDTNTHCTYSSEKRRQMTNDSFPYIGLEKEKPKTNPVFIGDDCWLGKRCVILKGVHIGENSTVATNAVVKKSCPVESIVYGNPAIHKQKAMI
jgi:acetyltransferase-like isoleucine patch superfamily enzyme